MARCLAVVISQAPGLSGTPDLRPLLQRHDQRILRQLLRQPNVAQHARQAGDELRRFHAPDRIDRAQHPVTGVIAMSVWVMQIVRHSGDDHTILAATAQAVDMCRNRLIAQSALQDDETTCGSEAS